MMRYAPSLQHALDCELTSREANSLTGRLATLETLLSRERLVFLQSVQSSTQENPLNAGQNTLIFKVQRPPYYYNRQKCQPLSTPG